MKAVIIAQVLSTIAANAAPSSRKSEADDQQNRIQEFFDANPDAFGCQQGNVAALVAKIIGKPIASKREVPTLKPLSPVSVVTNSNAHGVPMGSVGVYLGKGYAWFPATPADAWYVTESSIIPISKQQAKPALAGIKKNQDKFLNVIRDRFTLSQLGISL